MLHGKGLVAGPVFAPNRALESAGAPPALFNVCLSLARQARKPRDQSIDRSVEVFVNGVAINVTSRQGQACADGKYPIGTRFFAEHNLRAQYVGGETRQARHFSFYELSQPETELDAMRRDMDRYRIHIGVVC